jgi:hypothetical protein
MSESQLFEVIADLLQECCPEHYSVKKRYRDGLVRCVELTSPHIRALWASRISYGHNGLCILGIQSNAVPIDLTDPNAGDIIWHLTVNYAQKYLDFRLPNE